MKKILNNNSSPRLAVQSCFNFLDSLIKIKDYIDFAARNQWPWAGLIEYKQLIGAYEFYQQAKKHQIKPIIGLNFDINFKDQDIPVTVIAINNTGWQELIKLSSELELNKPGQLLKGHNFLSSTNLVIIISPTISIFKTVKMFVQQWDRKWYWGLNEINQQWLESEKFFATTSIVWLQPVRYFEPTQHEVFELLQAIKNQRTNQSDDFNIKNKFNINHEPHDIKYLQNLDQIIEQVNWSMPQFNFESSFWKVNTPHQYDSSWKYLHAITHKKLQAKNLLNQKLYRDRLNQELAVIKKLNFADYFLVVADYVTAAKSLDIYVGPGRGSAAASLVCYLLNITEVDPLDYDLIFERFLNVERQALPDIDIDFEDVKRDLVLNYLCEKYGHDHVAYINTCQTIGLKMAFRDAGRVLAVDLKIINSICQLIPNIGLEDFVNLILKNKTLQFYQDQNPLLFKWAMQMYGLPRQSSTHAAGIILTAGPLINYCPIMPGFNKMIKTQWEMNDLASAGLLKLDILGLRNLTMLHEVIKAVNLQTKRTLHLSDIALDDKNTFQLLASGDTQGIFQLESHGMTTTLQNMGVNSLEDIIVTLSIFRPGPQENIALFIRRKNNKEPINYYVDNKDFQKILAPTYGIVLYQEQVLRISQVVAGFTLTQADLLRRAMSKKDHDYMDQVYKSFITGAQNQGYKKEDIELIWNLIYKFSDYGFNRSHAVSYGLIGYWMAYFKANYFNQFICVLLNSFLGSTKIASYLREAKSRNLTILSPSIHQPDLQYCYYKAGIQVPILAVKQVGINFALAIKEAFHHHQGFKNIFDFFAQLLGKGLNKQNYFYLCFSGALDCLNLNRTTLWNNYELIVNYLQLIRISKKGMPDYYDYQLAPLPNLITFSDDKFKIINAEHDALGFYISKHPLVHLKENLALDHQVVEISTALQQSQGSVNVLCLVLRIKLTKDRRNQQMAFLDVIDESGEGSVTLFASLYNEYHHLIKVGAILLLNVRINEWKGRRSLVLNKLKIIKTNHEHSN